MLAMNIWIFLFFREEVLGKTPCPIYTSSDICDPREIKFFMDEKQILFDFETETVGETDFDGTKPTTFILHDAEMDHDSGQAVYLRKAYEESTDYNIIMASYARLITGRFCHKESHLNLDYIGKCVSKFLNALQPFQIHIVGISMGAKLASFISKYYEPGLDRVTGLDPAGTPWGDHSYALLITPNISEYTDIIHTEGNRYGYKLGHSDWHLNDGHDIQPGCPNNTDIPILSVICSYSMSLVFYAESVRDQDAFYGVRCESSDCPFQPPYYRMGEYVLNSTYGTFFLETNGQKPYGRGKPEN